MVANIQQRVSDLHLSEESIAITVWLRHSTDMPFHVEYASLQCMKFWLTWYSIPKLGDPSCVGPLCRAHLVHTPHMHGRAVYRMWTWIVVTIRRAELRNSKERRRRGDRHFNTDPSSPRSPRLHAWILADSEVPFAPLRSGWCGCLGTVQIRSVILIMFMKTITYRKVTPNSLSLRRWSFREGCHPSDTWSGCLGEPRLTCCIRRS